MSKQPIRHYIAKTLVSIADAICETLPPPENNGRRGNMVKQGNTFALFQNKVRASLHQISAFTTPDQSDKPVQLVMLELTNGSHSAQIMFDNTSLRDIGIALIAAHQEYRDILPVLCHNDPHVEASRPSLRELADRDATYKPERKTAKVVRLHPHNEV